MREKLIYYPTVTREPFRNQRPPHRPDRVGKLCADIGLPQLNAENDRAMLCGSPHMLQDLRILLDSPAASKKATTASPVIS